LMTRTWNE